MMTRIAFSMPRIASIAVLGALVTLVSCSEFGTPSRQGLYRMGDRAEAGALVYTVLEADWQPQLGEGASARVPRNSFLMLRVSITNGGVQSASIPQMRLIGPGGESYQELTDGTGVQQWLGIVRSLRPADTMVGRVLFDVPRADYRLEVGDDAFDPEQKATALIEVPLRFESGGDTLPERRAL